MQTINTISLERAEGKTKELLEGIKGKLGMVPNIMATMANSNAVLQAYLNFSEALSQGELPDKLREQIALTVAETNSCKYCLSAHTAIGKMVGLSDEEIEDSRRASSTDSKAEAVLKFSKIMVEKRGNVNSTDIDHLRKEGFSDSDITEIVANIALNLFTNYFNHVADTEIDFPPAREL